MERPKKKTSSLLISIQLSWLQVLSRLYLLAKRTFANSHEQFGHTSYFSGLICYMFNAPPFDLGPFSTQSLTKSNRIHSILSFCVTAAANDSCNFIGLILQSCHKCSYRQEWIILLQAAWQERRQPTLGFHVCPGRHLCSKYILAQACSGCHIRILRFLSCI